MDHSARQDLIDLESLDLGQQPYPKSRAGSTRSARLPGDSGLSNSSRGT